MKLSSILNREANNLDIFRVFAAYLVIYSHSFILSPEVGRSELFNQIFVVNAADFAVAVFFFLSGLVVTNSIIEKRSPLKFMLARFFRIWPALIVVVTFSALILGPLVTTLSIADYFSNSGVYRYIYQNLVLSINFHLPGVFENNPYKLAVNGSLWTIPHEYIAYCAVGMLFFLRVFNYKILPALLLLAVLLDTIAFRQNMRTWLPIANEAKYLALFFMFGTFLASYKKYININIFSIALPWILCFVFNKTEAFLYFYFMAIFLSIVYISSLKFLLLFKPKSDISYGIYLWGFPVQQTLALYFHDKGMLFNLISALAICSVIGWFSWHWIEKPGINFGRRITSKLLP